MVDGVMVRPAVAADVTSVVSVINDAFRVERFLSMAIASRRPRSSV